VSEATDVRDGRSTRWDDHRAQRRVELLDATIKAIRRHGAGVGMDEIAAAAGTSKTVVYRHFSDRAGLYRAIAERVEGQILHDLSTPVASGASRTNADGRDLLRNLIEPYLRLVERDPELYRFVVSPPPGSGDDATSEISSRVTREVRDRLLDLLAETGRPDLDAGVWATALVGSVRAVADEWVGHTGPFADLDRAELTDQLTDLMWTGLAAIWPTSA
jgi:AcrR family transcriptional regulator